MNSNKPTLKMVLLSGIVPLLGLTAFLLEGKMPWYAAIAVCIGIWLLFIVLCLSDRESNRWIKAYPDRLRIQLGFIEWRNLIYSKVTGIGVVRPGWNRSDPIILFHGEKGELMRFSVRNAERNDVWHVLRQHFPGIKIPDSDWAESDDFMILWERSE